MQYRHDPVSLRIRCLNDAGMLAVLSLLLVPVYLLVNQYWQSVLRLILLYGLLGLFCLRLGGYVRRVMQRLPAEIPPWQAGPPTASANHWPGTYFGAAEAIQHVRKDPRYMQEVLKPRLQQLLVYRLSGASDLPLEALADTQLAKVEPALLAFFHRREDTRLWARYRYRGQRVTDVLEALQQLEAL